MRRIITLVILITALLGTTAAWGADNDSSAGTHYYDVNKMLFYEQGMDNTAAVKAELDGTHKDMVHPFAHYRALTGRGCVVNDIFNTVGVVSWPKNLGNMTNDSLSDYTSFVNGVSATVVYDPITSIRDMTRHYAKGTTAGFCIGQEGGTGVLSVQLLKKFSLEFYCEGKKVGAVYATSGSNFNGVNVSLGALPNSKNSTYNIQAVAPAEFDEIRLVNTGIEVSALSGLDVHYAYVGKPTLYTLTNKDEPGKKPNPQKDFDDYCTDYGKTKTKDVSGPSTLVNNDITDWVLGNAILTVGSSIPVKAMTYTDGEETFHAGSVVGFKGVGGSALNLSLIGGGITIKTYNKKNEVVERFNMDQSLLGLSLIKGGESNLTFITTKPFSGVSIQYTGLLNVDLGGTVFNYAFVEPAPDMEHHCDIDPTPDMNICEDQTSIQLYHNPKVSVKWSCVSGNASIDNNGNVTGMKGDGGTVYTFRATAADGCYDDVTITKNQGKSSSDATAYEQIISKSMGFEKAKSVPGTTGSLITISYFDDPNDHLLDGDKTTYATYTRGLQVAGHVGVVAIQTTGKEKTFRNALDIAAGDSIKIGFVVQSSGTGLNINLLNGYSMEFYKDNKNVYTSVLTQANVLNVSLAGTDKLQKLELAAIVPKDIDFDQMALYQNGVLGVNASKQYFYYPFYETGKDIEISDNPLGCEYMVDSVPVVITTDSKSPSSSASIDGNRTGTYSTVTLAGGIDDLSNLIDGSLSTGVTLGSVAQVGGGTILAVKLGRRADYRQQLAIVMDNNNYQKIFSHKDGTGLDPLGIGVGKWMKVETYLNGVATGDSKTDWNVLGADVITTKGHNIYVWNPKKKYDEVVITLANVVGVAQVQKIYGIVLQSDIDGDGVPDCKDDDSCQGAVSDMNSPHTCLGDNITFSFTGKPTVNYMIEAADQSDSLLSVTKSEVDENTGTCTYTCTVKTIKTGIFSARIMQESNSKLSGYEQDGVIDYTVHPLITHWNPITTSTDWNVWDNWIEGSPYQCTDVVITKGAKVYPVLTATTDTIKNKCHNIHFEPGAAIENVFRLTYKGSAWVDLGLRNGVASLWTSPVGQLFSGDLYASKVEPEDYFTDLTDQTDPATFASRSNPLIYQRIWKKSVKGNYITGSKSLEAVTLISKGTWSHAFNSISQSYSTVDKKDKNAPACFSLLADDNSNSDSTYIIHLPKAGERHYSYYDAIGAEKGSATVQHDDGAKKLWSTALGLDGDSFTLNYSNDASSSGTSSEEEAGTFLVGNPTMSHLDIATFLKKNETYVKGIKTYRNNTMASIIDVNGTLIGSNALTDDDKYVAPAGAFFAVAQDTTKTLLSVTYDSTMFGGKAVQQQAASAKANLLDNGFGLIRITASSGKYSSGTVLMEGTDARAATLMDEDYTPNVALFSIDNGKAYDIRPENSDVIELGIVMAKADSVTMDFRAEGNADANGWKLYDRLTGKSYASGEAPVIYIDASSVGRFYMSRIGSTDGIKAASNPSGIIATIANGRATVTSKRNDISRVEVLTEGGTLVNVASANGADSVSLDAQRGVVIIRVTRSDGKVNTFKLMSL